MVQDGESQATAEIIAGADTHSTSSNGFGAATAPQTMPNPVILVGATVAAGLLIAGLVRRFRG